MDLWYYGGQMRKTKFISIFKSVDFARRKIPLLIEDSEKAGPTVWVVAAIHGDEVTGIETVLRLNRYLKRNPLQKGRLYSLPVMNPTGYELISRREPIGSADLNRCFPGHPQGDHAERTAYKIFSAIKETKPDLVIDFHTDTMESIPYVYLDQVLSAKDKKLVEKTLEYARVSGINYFVENAKTYKDLEKSITGALLNIAKIPSFTIELGGPLLVKERFVEVGLNAVKNILAHLEMIPATKPKWVYPHKMPLEGLYETVWKQYSADYSGIVEYKVQPGTTAKKGQPLARIKNLFDQTLQVIKANEEAVVISYADQSVCFPGTELLMMARRNDHAFSHLG